MINKILIYFILISSMCGCRNKNPIEEIKLTNLRCELLNNPIGIDISQPGLSWEISSNQRNIKQSSYRILVASSRELLDQNTGDIWDTGQKESSQSIHIRYEGRALKSNSKYYWKAKVWTENGESPWSEIAFWSMGYLYANEWKGRWIGLDRSFPWDDEGQFSRLSARYFRKEFKTKEREITDAKLHIIGLGLYELYINVEKIGDQVLAPCPTDYTKNVKFNSFDITANIKNGVNAIGVVLGNGRYYTMRQNYKPYKIKTFGYPKLLLNLIVEYSDGTKEEIATDDSWKVTTDGPIRSNNEYDGEEYDARKEMPGWNMSGFNDNKWTNAEYVQEPGGNIEAQLNENMKIMKVIQPISIAKLSGNKYILDMGQNFAGWLRIKVQGRAGDKVIMRFGESLKENGELFTTNLRDAKVTDVYILKGGDTETWQPSFVYHGFRYAEISGYPGIPELKDFEGCVVYDNMANTGNFETSDPLINRIYKNAHWSVISTYKGVPIDCPQRNERMPWLGDRAIGCYGESFMTDNSRLYLKWMDDIKNSQKADGSIADVAPPYFRYYSDNMTWPGTYLFVADMLYKQYGLTEPVKIHYPYMKKWLNYMQERYLENYILTKDSYGDWCAPPKTIEEGRGKSADKKNPSQLIATAYFYQYLQMMQEFAGISGNISDRVTYKSLADSVKEAFNHKFFNPESAYYGDSSLTENLLPLYFKLFPLEQKENVVRNIRDIILVQNQGHLSSGLIGVQWLMRSLAENGMNDIAFKLATNTTYPSWGYMIENGATTIWELWNANTAAPNMNSQNHVMMLGDLVIWFYENLAGIKSSTEFPGFKEIIMEPSFINGLDYVNASFQSVYGLIKSNWKKEDGKILWNISIPANTTALIAFPVKNKEKINESNLNINKVNGFKFVGYKNNKTYFKIGSGEYNFEIITN